MSRIWSTFSAMIVIRAIWIQTLLAQKTRSPQRLGLIQLDSPSDASVDHTEAD
jgi:hypothetical protein